MNLFRFIPGYETGIYEAGREPALVTTRSGEGRLRGANRGQERSSARGTDEQTRAVVW